MSRKLFENRVSSLKHQWNLLKDYDVKYFFLSGALRTLEILHGPLGGRGPQFGNH
ncbi:hypothetical protein WDU94_005003, partial [Cyamophila willieti]